jgi:hypothetical protein
LLKIDSNSYMRFQVFTIVSILMVFWCVIGYCIGYLKS